MITLDKLKELNEAYRTGDPLVSDSEYDDMLQEYRDAHPDEDIQLMDPIGKVRHEFVIGSLKKLKHDEPEPLEDWASANIGEMMFTSAKIDGMSIVAEYKNGKLIKACTRGDGYLGEDQTDKVRLIQPEVDASFTGVIRGELTLTFDSFEELKALVPDKDHKNLRNSTVGIINSKNSVTDEMVKLVKLYAYQILKSDSDFQKMTRKAQFLKLEELGFEIPVWADMGKKYINCTNLTTLYKQTCNMSPYMVDGLVLCDISYSENEDVYYPNGMRAFKVNDEFQWSTVTGIKWNLSKTGALAPVVQFDPIELVGTTVSQASGYNYEQISKQGIDVGAKVKVIKSGDIIPKIIEVEHGFVGDYDHSKVVCPECGSHTELLEDSVHLHCANPKCTGKTLMEVESFILKLGVEGASKTTLRNLGIMDFDALLSFNPDKDSVSQTKLAQELKSKVYSASCQDLLAAMYWNGCGSKIVNKMIAHFGDHVQFLMFLKGISDKTDLPKGVGEKMVDSMRLNVIQNIELLEAINAHPERVVPKETKAPPIDGPLKGMKITLTGRFERYAKKALQALLESKGAEIVSFSKKSTHLVCGGKPGPSKLKKAEGWGVKVLSEDEILDM